MDYVTRGACGQEGCRETRYYLDNGLWFCLRGHQQEVRAPCISIGDGESSGRDRHSSRAACPFGLYRDDKLKRTLKTSERRAK